MVARSGWRTACQSSPVCARSRHRVVCQYLQSSLSCLTTGAHSCILDEPQLIWNQLLNYARAHVYNVCRRSTRSKLPCAPLKLQPQGQHRWKGACCYLRSLSLSASSADASQAVPWTTAQQNLQTVAITQSLSLCMHAHSLTPQVSPLLVARC